MLLLTIVKMSTYVIKFPPPLSMEKTVSFLDIVTAKTDGLKSHPKDGVFLPIDMLTIGVTI